MHADTHRRRGSILGFTCVLAVLLLMLVGVVMAQRQAARDLTASRNREEAVRENWQRLNDVFPLAGIAPGAKVADVGAGSGFLTVRLARAVGPNGRVYAVDIVPRVLEGLRERVREEGLHNVEVVEGAIDDSGLPRDALDSVIIIYAYHEMSEHEAMLRHVRESLKPTRRLVLIEPTSRLVAPDRRAQRDADVLSAELAENDLRAAGFHVAELRDPFATELSGRSLQWLILAHRAPGVLLSRTRPQAHRAGTADGRVVVAPPGADDNITRADLRLSAADVRKRVEAGSATIVDLRSDAEYRAGHIRRAISVLPGEVGAKLSAIASRHEPVFLYCA
jgi:FkbM family methyltransferase